MTESKEHTAPDLDEAPDLSAPEWQEKFAKAKVRRGRPKADKTKQSTTIRLSPEVIEHFKADGPGWQTRIDDALLQIVEQERG